MLAMCFNDDEIECDIGFKMIAEPQWPSACSIILHDNIDINGLPKLIATRLHISREEALEEKGFGLGL